MRQALSFHGLAIALLISLTCPVGSMAQDEFVLDVSNESASAGSTIPQPVPPAPEVAAREAEPDSFTRSGYESTTASETPCQTCNGDCEYGDCRLSFWDRFRCSKFCDRMRRIHERLDGCCRKPKPAPLGTLVNAHIDRYVQRGREARMVFYRYDFKAGTTDLNHTGRKKLKQIGDWLPKSFAPVIIERTAQDPELAENRRTTIVKEFNAMSFPVPDERVIVGSPISKGLSPIEANVILQNQLIQTGLRGVSSSGGGGGGGGGGGSQGNSGQYQNQTLGSSGSGSQ